MAGYWNENIPDLVYLDNHAGECLFPIRIHTCELGSKIVEYRAETQLEEIAEDETEHTRKGRESRWR
jgi:hypothetical protein